MMIFNSKVRMQIITYKANRAMSSMIYTADLTPQDPAVCTLGACEHSSDLASHLVTAFSTRQNSTRYLSTPQGQDAVFAYLMTTRSAMALTEREMTPFESVPYRKLLNSQPFSIRVAICAPVSACVYVHRANPLAHITLQQLSQVFSRGNLTGDYSTWAQLDTTTTGGIHPLRLPDIAPFSVFLQQHFEQRQPGWNGEYVRDTDALIERLAALPTAIGIAEVGREHPQIRAVPISDGQGQVYNASLKNMQSGHYPLTRYLHLYLPRNPQGEISPPLVEFAEFVLSAEGQKLINTRTRYASLSDEMARSQSRLMAHCL
ncbi:ABC-type phosphate transport system substrate-binding protein [Enterobacter sp. BIGb0383]|nr:ABC-type phosphate transport system substrate-binding protein [Enterobacter sp. BIGb0383]ROS11928.1 ABC-type phosphate transport system substrate-binding protein [Enterobacter sp. BIGb0359]